MVLTSKMIKKLHNALFTDDDLLFFDEDSGNVPFSSDEMGIFSVDLDNINLDGVNIDEDDSETVIQARQMAWRNRHKQCKACQKNMSKELMSVG